MTHFQEIFGPPKWHLWKTTNACDIMASMFWWWSPAFHHYASYSPRGKNCFKHHRQYIDVKAGIELDIIWGPISLIFCILQLNFSYATHD